jgi:predicted MPP superfamily phosphohydrolase
MWLKFLEFITALVVYGAGIEPRFVVRNDETATIPNLPPAWEGKQIATFADMQVGIWLANVDAVRRAVGKVVNARPSLVLLPGDFVYEADEDVDTQMQKVVALLQPILDDSIPVYAVLGNHDYSLMNEHSEQENAVARRVRIALDHAGVHMMDNQVRPLTMASTAADGVNDTLYLAGVGEKWAKNDRAAETVAMIPRGAPRIIFMHDPDSFAKIPPGDAPFAIAAHTHGMQLGIPWLSDYLWRHYFSDTGSGVEGWQDGASGNRLYINRGIGFSIVPARVNAVPEVTVFTLKRAGP